MKASDDSGRNFKGGNENVTITVEAQDTNFLVNYVEDGLDKVLQNGTPISFPFPSGTAKNIQFSFRFSTTSGGKYIVTVKSVDGFPNGRVRTYRQQGGLPVIIDYSFIPA
jgi:hypothetical protein